MLKIRIFVGDDSVDLLMDKEEFWKLQNFINRQENMQVFEIR